MHRHLILTRELLIYNNLAFILLIKTSSVDFKLEMIDTNMQPYPLLSIAHIVSCDVTKLTFCVYKS